MKNIFKQGPISSDFIAQSIAKHQPKTDIGGHSIFLGQVRSDQFREKEVVAIDFTAEQEMANALMLEIREVTFERFSLSCMHIYHSIGRVRAGEICFFVFASSPRRKDCQAAVNHLVEEIKNKLPIFGKEIFNDNSHRWKKNN